MSLSAKSVGNKLRHNDFGGLYQLEKQAEKMGLTPEIKELAEGANELNQKIQQKNYELNVIESFAMESLDENITDLRNQLFTIVKLIHSEEIEEVLREANAQERFSANPSYIDSDKPSDKQFKASVFNRIRASFDKRKRLKKEINMLKQNFKENEDYYSNCDSEEKSESFT